jgi:hypothetical protein
MRPPSTWATASETAGSATLDFCVIGRTVACGQVAMFHTGATLPAALGTLPRLVKLLGLLTLDGLIEFGGSELADFVTEFFDLIPCQLHRRAVFPIGLGADHTTEFLHQFKRLGRKPGATFCYCF